MTDPVLQPMKPPDAKTLARDIMENGVVVVSDHAKKEMANDELETTDCLNLIRAGTYEPAEIHNGEWRYRIVTRTVCVVIAFQSTTRLRVVTAWRFK